MYHKKRKSQMSLEMIIGLLILLVVAVVIIRIFLDVFGPEPLPRDEIDEILRRKKFISECESFCNEYVSTGNIAQLSHYCSTKYDGRDINKNGIIDKIQD